MSIYAKGYRTGYANLGNGEPATLFSSVDQEVVNSHFSLMQQNGCDTPEAGLAAATWLPTSRSP